MLASAAMKASLERSCEAIFPTCSSPVSIIFFKTELSRSIAGRYVPLGAASRFVDTPTPRI